MSTSRFLARHLGLLAAILAAGLWARDGWSQEKAADADPQYLLFQLFTAGPGFSTEPNRRAISKLPDTGFLDRAAKSIVDAIGERGDGRRRLGVTVGPLALDHTDAQLRTLVEWTFAIARKHRIAVALHIDDSKFWLNRRDLWSDPRNIESLDWKGTKTTGQYLNWGEPWKLAPQACLNSVGMMDEARRIAGSVLGPAIVEQVAKLRETGDEGLFAGVIVGWETAIGLDYETRRGLGYCALANRGYSASKPPADPDRELETVVKDWIGIWAQALVDAGISSDRIYSHITFDSKKRFDEGRNRAGRSYSSSVLYTPPDVAFGRFHRPAFSTYPDADILQEIYAALASHGNPRWGSAEGTNVSIQGPPRIPDEGMEDYLARMFNHGAAMANLFGWGIGAVGNPFRQATERPEAIAAYRKFLRGTPLAEKPLADSYRSSLSLLQQRLRALPSKIEKYLQSGGNPQVIQPRVKRMEEYMGEGRLEEVRKELDQIEAALAAKLGDKDSAPGTGFDVGLLQQKVRALSGRIDAYQRRGGNMSPVKARMERLQKRLEAGELELAFQEVQELDRILGAP